MFRVWSGEESCLNTYLAREKAQKPARPALKPLERLREEMEGGLTAWVVDAKRIRRRRRRSPPDPRSYRRPLKAESSPKSLSLREERSESFDSVAASKLLNFQCPTFIERVPARDDDCSDFPLEEKPNEVTSDVMNGMYFKRKPLSAKKPLHSNARRAWSSSSSLSFTTLPQQLTKEEAKSAAKSTRHELRFSIFDEGLTHSKRPTKKSSIVHEEFIRASREEEVNLVDDFTEISRRDDQAAAREPRSLKTSRSRLNAQSWCEKSLDDVADDSSIVETSYVALLDELMTTTKKLDGCDSINFEDPFLSKNSFDEKFPPSLSLALQDAPMSAATWRRDRLSCAFTRRRGMATKSLFSSQAYPYLATRQPKSVFSDDLKLIDMYWTTLSLPRSVVKPSRLRMGSSSLTLRRRRSFDESAFRALRRRLSEEVFASPAMTLSSYLKGFLVVRPPVYTLKSQRAGAISPDKVSKDAPASSSSSSRPSPSNVERRESPTTFTPQQKAPSEKTVAKNPPITILMSENLINRHHSLLLGLQEKCGLSCVDCNLDAGVDFIIDDFTAVAILPAEIVREKQSLKIAVKDLVGCAFKYDRIWLLVIEDEVPFDPTCISAFLLATNNFPCSLVVRNTTADDIFNFFNVIVCDAMTQAYAMSVTSVEYCDRSFLECLTDPRLLARCVLLQMFPTVNMFIAARLIARFKSIQNILKEDFHAVCQSLCLPNNERVSKFLSFLHDVT